MFAGLQEHQLTGALEAMLFVTDEPVGTIALADMLEVEPAEVERGAGGFARAAGRREPRHPAARGSRRLAAGHAPGLPRAHRALRALVGHAQALAGRHGALAIVAYSQPVTRASVASVRGVNSDNSINSLVEKGLVREAGTAEAPGNPHALRHHARVSGEVRPALGGRTCPTSASSRPDAETRAFIRERLSATRDVPRPDGADGDIASGASGGSDVLRRLRREGRCRRGRRPRVQGAGRR